MESIVNLRHLEMYKDENKKVAQYFDIGCDTNEESWAAAYWGSEETQQGFFAITAAILKPESRLLEVGCGQGDLWEFLFCRKIRAIYEGIDISSEMIRYAQGRYPQANFQQEDLFDKEGEYDLVVGCGAFNFKIMDKQEQYFKDAIKKMYDLSTNQVLVAGLSKYAPTLYEDVYYYYDPGEILNYCLSLTPTATLNHASIDHHFFIHMTKHPEGPSDALRGS